MAQKILSSEQKEKHNYYSIAKLKPRMGQLIK